MANRARIYFNYASDRWEVRDKFGNLQLHLSQDELKLSIPSMVAVGSMYADDLTVGSTVYTPKASVTNMLLTTGTLASINVGTLATIRRATVTETMVTTGTLASVNIGTLATIQRATITEEMVTTGTLASVNIGTLATIRRATMNDGSFGAGSTITKLGFLTGTIPLTNIGTLGNAVASIAATGVAAGDKIFVTAKAALAAGVIIGHVIAQGTDNITVDLANVSITQVGSQPAVGVDILYVR